MVRRIIIQWKTDLNPVEKLSYLGREAAGFGSKGGVTDKVSNS